MYDTGDYAGSRINGTVVMLKRCPVYVNRVTRDKIVLCHTLGRGRRDIKGDLSAFNLTNYQLGYFNHDGTAYYMSRKAMRQDWRQGLRVNNVRCSPIKYDLCNLDIAQCLRQRHPTFSEALVMIGKGAGSCAWTKDLCVTHRQQIKWKGLVVGTIDDSAINLNKKFKFLAKLIGESTHECYEVI